MTTTATLTTPQPSGRKFRGPPMSPLSRLGRAALPIVGTGVVHALRSRASGRVQFLKEVQHGLKTRYDLFTYETSARSPRLRPGVRESSPSTLAVHLSLLLHHTTPDGGDFRATDHQEASMDTEQLTNLVTNVLFMNYPGETEGN